MTAVASDTKSSKSSFDFGSIFGPDVHPEHVTSVDVTDKTLTITHLGATYTAAFVSNEAALLCQTAVQEAVKKARQQASRIYYSGALGIFPIDIVKSVFRSHDSVEFEFHGGRHDRLLKCDPAVATQEVAHLQDLMQKAGLVNFDATTSERKKLRKRIHLTHVNLPLDEITECHVTRNELIIFFKVG